MTHDNNLYRLITFKYSDNCECELGLLHMTVYMNEFL